MNAADPRPDRRDLVGLLTSRWALLGLHNSEWWFMVAEEWSHRFAYEFFGQGPATDTVEFLEQA